MLGPTVWTFSHFGRVSACTRRRRIPAHLRIGSSNAQVTVRASTHPTCRFATFGDPQAMNFEATSQRRGASVETCTVLLFVGFTLCFVGCSDSPSETSDPWHHEALDIADVRSLSLVAGAYHQDGGTIEIYGVSGSGHRCVVRLNQIKLTGEYVLNVPDSPGRLCFNERLIRVRSTDEVQLIELLQAAEVTPLRLNDVRKIQELSRVTQADLEGLSVKDDRGEVDRLRNSIVDCVNSERYIDIAENGIPTPAKYGR